MNCCRSEAINGHFGESHAREDLLRYRREGPRRITRILLDGLQPRCEQDATLLDIGGGIGVIPHELLADRMRQATIVEIATSYVEVGEAEIKRRELEDRITYLHGDFLELGARIAPADVVTLNRAVCCYPEFVQLVQRSAAKAHRWYALSYPLDRWYVRLGVALRNLQRRRRGNAFRTYVHPPRRMHQLLTEAGFRRDFRRSTLWWEASIYGRM